MNNNQTLLMISLPEGVELRSATFREMLAKDERLPEEFFGYKDGKPRVANPGDLLEISSLPNFCILGGKRWVGILAQPGNDDLMDIAVGRAMRLVNERVGQVCKVNMHNVPIECHKSPMPVTYFVREMVLNRRTPEALAANVEDLVARRIKNGIERYAQKHALDLPSWDEIDLRVTECQRPRGLEIISRDGPTGHYATLVDVEFKAFLKLGGTWMLGNLTSRGYGRVCNFREGRQSKLEVLK